MRFVGNLVLFIGAAGLMYLASWTAYDLVAQSGDSPELFSQEWIGEFAPGYAVCLGVMVIGAVIRLRAKGR